MKTLETKLPSIKLDWYNNYVIDERKDKKVEVTNKELRILYNLIENLNTPVSYDALNEAVFGSCKGISNSLQVQMSSLRKKVKSIIKIETRRNEGYLVKCKETL